MTIGGPWDDYSTEVRLRAEAIGANSAKALLGQLEAELALVSAVAMADRIVRQVEVAEQERRLRHAA